MENIGSNIFHLLPPLEPQEPEADYEFREVENAD